jgi:hypothetical protein
MSTEQVELLGITKNDIQEIFQKVIDETKPRIPKLIYIDANYLYTFHLDDFVDVRKLTLLTRYDHSLAIEWHRLLERWYQDQTVHINNRLIKPIKISRTFDRVTNEGMEMIAGCITGEESGTFEYRSIGDGVISAASPGDKVLSNEVDRINVNETPEGGSISRDGTTIYSIGNHEKSVPTPANDEFTECGIHSTDDPNTDKMLDHSVFADPVPHTQNADAPGSTTVIYMCSS